MSREHEPIPHGVRVKLAEAAKMWVDGLDRKEWRERVEAGWSTTMGGTADFIAAAERAAFREMWPDEVQG